MELLKKLAKLKKKRILVLSAASVHSGFQCLYAEVHRDKWMVLHTQLVQYPPKIRSLVDSICFSALASNSLRELAILDCELSRFALECGQSVLSQVGKPLATPDAVILNRMCLWTDTIDTSQYKAWNLLLGEPQVVATGLRAPVYTDLSRHDILSGGLGFLPTLVGDMRIARKAGDIAAFVNIGLISHLTIIDTSRNQVLLDSDTGPGTILINHAARTAGCPDGFDRDGNAARKAHVNTDVLEYLTSAPWFSLQAPKRARPDEFDALLRSPLLGTLTPDDVLATITALTARTIFNFFRREYHHDRMPDTLWVSGGGTRNLALMDFLAAYFKPTRVQSVEKLDVPVEMRLPLSLALSLATLLDKKALFPHTEPDAFAIAPGKWVHP